jgi:hypothetical protein
MLSALMRMRESHYFWQVSGDSPKITAVTAEMSQIFSLCSIAELSKNLQATIRNALCNSISNFENRCQVTTFFH